MLRNKKLFYKLIECAECGNNYRYQKDRSIPKWLCGGYARKLSNCERNAIEEEYLIQMVSAYCFKNRILFEPTYDFMRRVVDKIYVSKQEIRIEYKNNNEDDSIVTENLYKI